jgi:flagellar biosynthesis GTPase FlhF
MVLSHPISGSQAAVALSVVGAPLFVAEIASASTLDTDRVGKRIAYALAGIPEYLLFDPSGGLLAAPIEAWRLPWPGARVYQPWLPEPDGSWRSQSLEVWFVPDLPILRVRGKDGQLLDPPLATARRARREAVARVDAETRALQAETQRRQEAAARQAAEERERQEAAARQAAEERERQEAAARQAAEERERQEAAARRAAEERERQEAAARQAAEERERQEAAARQAAEERERQEAAARLAAEETLQVQQKQMDALRTELERLRALLNPGNGA